MADAICYPYNLHVLHKQTLNVLLALIAAGALGSCASHGGKTPDRRPVSASTDVTQDTATSGQQDGDDDPPVNFASPSGEYTISESMGQEVSILHGGKVMASYPFDGSICVPYWSPSGRYVAFDNHFGHYAYAIWIFNLRDGSVVTRHGPTAAPDYDKYTDDADLQDIMAWKEVTQAVHAVYPNYATDRPGPPLAIAYGWKKGDILETFHRMVFMDLLDKQNAVVEVLTQDKVDPSGVHPFGIPQAKLINFKSEPAGEPPEVRLVWP